MLPKRFSLIIGMYDVPTYFADGFIIGKIYSAATNDPVIRDQHIIRLYFSIQIITQINFFFRRKIFWLEFNL